MVKKLLLLLSCLTLFGCHCFCPHKDPPTEPNVYRVYETVPGEVTVVQRIKVTEYTTYEQGY